MLHQVHYDETYRALHRSVAHQVGVKVFGNSWCLTFVINTERMANREPDDGPAPGSYDIGEDLLRVSLPNSIILRK